MTNTQQITDAELKRLVTDELTWTPSVNSTHIGVAVDQGAVTLFGEVDSYPEKLAAEQAALRVRGVVAVAEEITVRRSDAHDDAGIAQAVTRALDDAADVPPNAVKAAVHAHSIVLTGNVDWRYQRDAAARAVQYLKGVTGVTNLITVTPRVSTEGVKTAITNALLRSAQLEGRNLTVTSGPDGSVTLEGRVHSWAERRQAEHAAWSAPGVRTVHNNILIGR